MAWDIGHLGQTTGVQVQGQVTVPTPVGLLAKLSGCASSPWGTQFCSVAPHHGTIVALGTSHLATWPSLHSLSWLMSPKSQQEQVGWWLQSPLYRQGTGPEQLWVFPESSLIPEALPRRSELGCGGTWFFILNPAPTDHGRPKYCQASTSSAVSEPLLWKVVCEGLLI